VVPDGSSPTGFVLEFEPRLPVEDWNAEISLLTGISAAKIMLDAGIGVLRTLPAADPDAVAALRAVARGLGIDWPAGATPAELLSGLPRDTPTALALRRAATSLLRGAGYTAFDTAVGAPPPADPGHAGIGGPYAHVTAPLRRLVDRFGTELCLAVTGGAAVPDWLRAALPGLPETMAASDAVAGAVTRACVDRTEAALLADRVGAEFDAVVLRASTDNGAGEVFLLDPPVLGRCTGVRQPGETARVRLVEADPATGRIGFAAER
jgi:exoribonuclease R